MTTTTIRAEPTVDPGTDPLVYVDTTVHIQLVDHHTPPRPIYALRTPDGAPIVTRRQIAVADTPVDFALAPQTEIAQAMSAALAAEGPGPFPTYYLVTVTAGSQTVWGPEKLTVWESASTLSWAEWIQAGTPLTPAELSALALHIQDMTVHLPPVPDADQYNLTVTNNDIAWTPFSSGGGQDIAYVDTPPTASDVGAPWEVRFKPPFFYQYCQTNDSPIEYAWFSWVARQIV